MTESITHDTTTDNSAEHEIDIRPMSGHVGAEIFGVDLSQPLDNEVVAALRAAWLRWKVVFFRDQRLTPGQQVAFGRQFGDLTPAHPIVPPEFPEQPEILVLNLGHRREPAEVSGMAPAEYDLWHTDVTFAPTPPMGSILRGLVVPAYGGDTQFSNLVAAYEHLAEPVKQLIDGLHAVNNDKTFGTTSKGIASVHPVVRVHPETGEKAVFVNPTMTSHIVELSPIESRHLLAMLFEHISKATFTCRFRWQPDSIAFWDNRAVAHLIPTDVPPGSQRTMHRITLAGDVPKGPDGFTSYSLAGEAGDTFGG